MARVFIDDESLHDIAESIRSKLNVETEYLPSEMADAIGSIETGMNLTSADAGKVVVENGGEYSLQSQTARSVTENGTYDTTTNNSLQVNVPSVTSADNGKVVVNGTLQSQTSVDITTNGTYDTTSNNSASVNVQPPLQSKTATANGTVSPDNGYYGLSSVKVAVQGGGGGSKNILSGTSIPTAQDGSDGDIYLLILANLVPDGATTNLIAGQNASNAYYAFDGNDSTFWTTSDGNYNNMYVGYDFSSPTIVKAVGICPRQLSGNVQIGEFKIQASNDLENWIDVSSGVFPNDASKYAGVWTRFNFENSTAYRAWRILALTLNGSVTFTIFGLQFYGEGSTIDNAYLKVDGSWVSLIGQSINDVDTGGDATPIMSVAEWDALSTEQKQAHGYVGLLMSESGFLRGSLVYGADYVPRWITSDNTVVAEYKLGDIVNGEYVGEGVLIGESLLENQYLMTNAVNGSQIPANVILPTTNGSFTAYVAAERLTGENRLIMSFGNENDSTSNGLGLLIGANNEVVLALWGDDTTFSSSSSQKRVDGMVIVALTFDSQSGAAIGYALRSDDSLDSLSKNRGRRNTSRVILGKSFPVAGTPTYDERTNLKVGYFAVTDGSDSAATILGNLQSIYTNLSSMLGG